LLRTPETREDAMGSIELGERKGPGVRVALLALESEGGQGDWTESREKKDISRGAHRKM